QPVRAADAGHLRGVADLRAGPVPHGLDHPVAYFPRLRGLCRRGRGLSCPRPRMSPAVRGALPTRVPAPMIRGFTFNDVLYLVAAMRWTLALTAIAFVGGGLVGLAIALLRVSSFAPLRAIGTV